MQSPQTGKYPPEWPLLAWAIKQAAGWKCVRCGHPHDRDSGHVLTVHHLDGNKDNCAWWNVAPLCQKCHLQIQHKVQMPRPWLYEHSDWFKPFAAGYYAHRHGLPEMHDLVIMPDVQKVLVLADMQEAADVHDWLDTVRCMMEHYLYQFKKGQSA